MATVSSTVRPINLGPNDNNHRYFSTVPVSVPNGDTLAVDLSSIASGKIDGQVFVPAGIEVASADGGSFGARVLTSRPTLARTWDEATRILSIVNSSGGALLLMVTGHVVVRNS